MMKEKILQLLNKYKDVCFEFGEEDIAISEENFENLAEEIVNHHRELLVCCEKKSVSYIDNTNIKLIIK